MVNKRENTSGKVYDLIETVGDPEEGRDPRKRKPLTLSDVMDENERMMAQKIRFAQAKQMERRTSVPVRLVS